MLDIPDAAILDLVMRMTEVSSKEVHNHLSGSVSYATVKRKLARLVEENLVVTTGKGKSTRYRMAPSHVLFYPVDLDRYFDKEVDERIIHSSFNFHLISEIMAECPVFATTETEMLDALQSKYDQHVSRLSPTALGKVLERWAIDLSWKSSQIEGNTYSLLETEILLKDKSTAAGRTREEAVMLLNHKATIDFLLEHPDFTRSLSVAVIEDIHRLLTRELAIDQGIRRHGVGISGTNYVPLDNEYQIREALEDMCSLINQRQNTFEKALLALALVSYIQPFVDGNKRTARLVCNALLLSHQYCPISFRTVDPATYKKAMLLFYEQNNITGIKRIFMEQFAFAVGTYA
ncbi:MAG: Fic family protein [Saprospiraceae bacterium]|nr:Fic family protein [Saprospiraceae bacterium]